MKKRNVFLIVFLSFLFMFVCQTSADSFRCRGKIVKLGDTQVGVMKKCGKPSFEAKNGSVWVYDYGPTRYLHYVKFSDGIVHRIHVGPYRR